MPTMDSKQLIGKRIKGLRQARGLSQATLAEKVGMSPKYLSSIERGKENPTLDTFIRLSAALGVELAELFQYEHERSPKELKQFISSVLKDPDETKLGLAVRALKAIYE